MDFTVQKAIENMPGNCCTKFGGSKRIRPSTRRHSPPWPSSTARDIELKWGQLFTGQPATGPFADLSLCPGRILAGRKENQCREGGSGSAPSLGAAKYFGTDQAAVQYDLYRGGVFPGRSCDQGATGVAGSGISGRWPGRRWRTQREHRWLKVRA